MAGTKSLIFDVLAKTEDSNDKLKLLQARLQEMKDRYGEMNLNIGADNLKARAAIDEIQVKMDALSRKVANPKISITGMERAALELDKMSLKMDDINAKAKGDSLLSKIFGSGGAFSKIGSVGSSIGSGILPTLIGAGVVSGAGILPAILPALLGMGIGGGGAVGAYALGNAANTQLQGFQSQLTSLLKVKNPTAADLASIAKLRSQISGIKTSDAGVLGVFSDVQGVGHAASSTFNQAITSGGKNSFASGLATDLSGVGKFIRSEGPDLAKMFQASLPFIKMFVDFMEKSAKILLPAFTQAMKEITPYLPQIEKGFLEIVQGLADFLKDLGPGMKDSAIFFVAAADGIKGILIALGVTISATAELLVKLAEGAKAAVRDITGAWKTLQHDTAHVFDDVRHAVSSALDFIRDDVVKPFVGAIVGTLHQLENAGSVVWNHIANSWEHLFNAPFEHMMRDLNEFAAKGLGIITHFVGDVTGKFTSFTGGLISKALNWADGMTKAFNKMVNQGVNAVSGLAGRVWNAAMQPVLNLINSFDGRASSAMHSAGSNLVDGLIRGIEGQFDNLLGTMQHMAKDVINNPVTRFFGMQSPSKLFRQHGQNIVEGLVLGIQQGSPSAQSAISNLTGSMSRSIAPAPRGGGNGGWIEARVQFDASDNAIVNAVGNSVRVFVKANGGGGTNSAQRALGQRA